MQAANWRISLKKDTYYDDSHLFSREIEFQIITTIIDDYLIRRYNFFLIIMVIVI